MSEIELRRDTDAVVYQDDPTGGRLVSWAQAASAANQLAKALSRTSFVPAAFKGNEYDATAAILMGDELGLSPLAALRSIYVIHGTPAMYARTMVALALSHGHSIWTEKSTDAEVVVCGQRRGSDHVERSVWTSARATKAGYAGNKKYQTNSQEMLFAKASAEVARKIAADVLAGVPMSVEDIELEQQETITVTRADPKRVQRRKPELVEPPEPTAEPDMVAEELITPAQMKKLHAAFNDQGISERDTRLAYVADVIGVEVASSKDLTKDQASRVINALERAE